MAQAVCGCGNLRLHLCKDYCKLDLCSGYQEWYVSGTAGTSGYTPLHFAARAGHCAAVQMLLDAGGDQYVVSQDLVSCYGAYCSSLTGADPNRVTSAGGATSLHRAAYMGHDAVVRLLCALDCSPGLAFDKGRVLVCCAPSWANRQSASHLRRGALPDGRGSGHILCTDTSL